MYILSCVYICQSLVCIIRIVSLGFSSHLKLENSYSETFKMFVP